MRVMVLVKATNDSEAGVMPDPGSLEAMTQFSEDLAAAGNMVTADGLKPSSAGKCVRFDGDKRTVVDGPFGEPEDLVAGFWIWEVKDMAAIHWCTASGMTERVAQLAYDGSPNPRCRAM